MVGRLCSLPCSVEPQPASAAQIVPQQSRCSLRYARTAPHLLRAVRRIPTSNSRESALKRPDILGPQVSRSKLPQPSDVHRSPMGHSCDRPSSIQRICPASDDATASAHIQVRLYHHALAQTGTVPSCHTCQYNTRRITTLKMIA